MAIGGFRSVTLDVNDLETGERFWSSVLGLEPQWPPSKGMPFSRLGAKGPGSVLLQLVPEKKSDLKNRAHIDVTVMDVARAIEQVLELGGELVRPPDFWPEGEKKLLEWAVMADPFGNEFCLIREVIPTL